MDERKREKFLWLENLSVRGQSNYDKGDLDWTKYISTATKIFEIPPFDPPIKLFFHVSNTIRFFARRMLQLFCHFHTCCYCHWRERKSWSKIWAPNCWRTWCWRHSSCKYFQYLIFIIVILKIIFIFFEFQFAYVSEFFTSFSKWFSFTCGIIP